MRGDVHRLHTNRGAKGHEQQGRRFCVIVQSDDLPLSTVLVAPTSTSARETSFRPRIDVAGVQTLILAEQTVAADFSRLGERVGRLSRRELDELEKALRTVLALD